MTVKPGMILVNSAEALRDVVATTSETIAVSVQRDRLPTPEEEEK